jgi:hypothetical protein
MAQVDLNTCETEKCEKCQWQFYKERTLIKRIPGFITGGSVDTYTAVSFYACEKCGTAHRGTKINIVPKDDVLKIEK